MGTPRPKTVFIALRVAPDVVKSVDEVASQQGKSRSELIRDLLQNAHSLYGLLVAEREKQRGAIELLGGPLSQWILANMPKGTTPEIVRFIAEVMNQTAEQMIRKSENRGSTQLPGVDKKAA